MTLQRHLITLRRKKGLTQQQAADLIGIHIRTYRRYETLDQLVPWWREDKIKEVFNE